MEQEKTVLSKGLAFLKQATIWTTVVLLLLLGFTVLYVYFFFELFGMIQGALLNNLGLDGFLAKGVTALLMAIIFYFPTGRLIKSFLPLPQKNKGAYRALAFSIIAIIFFSAHFFAPEVYFDRETGKSLKFYSVSSDGEYRFYSIGGFDPVTGDSLKPVTKDIIIKDREEKKKKEVNKKPQIFSPQTAPSQTTSKTDNKISDVFSSGVVINNTSETVYFSVSKKIWVNKFIASLEDSYRIAPSDTLALSLEEGTHIFTMFDVDGKPISYNKYTGLSKDSYAGLVKVDNISYAYSYAYVIKISLKEWALVFEDSSVNFK